MMAKHGGTIAKNPNRTSFPLNIAWCSILLILKCTCGSSPIFNNEGYYSNVLPGHTKPVQTNDTGTGERKEVAGLIYRGRSSASSEIGVLKFC
jgi:hypothetical protein